MSDYLKQIENEFQEIYKACEKEMIYNDETTVDILIHNFKKSQKYIENDISKLNLKLQKIIDNDNSQSEKIGQLMTDYCQKIINLSTNQK